MATKTLTLKEFESEICNISNLEINLSLPMQNNAASPIQLHYSTNDIKIVFTFPERIILKSGNSILHISQIKKIVRKETEFDTFYEIYCGYLDNLETKIRLVQS